MIEQDLIYILKSGVDIQDCKIINAILDAFDNLLVANEDCNKLNKDYGIAHDKIFHELEKFELVKILEELQKFPIKEIYEKALRVVERHFLINEETN